MQPSRSLHWPSVWQFALSGLSALGLLGLAVVLLSLGLVQVADGTSASGQITPTFLMSASMALVGVLLIPSSAYALLRLLGKRLPSNSPSGAWQTIKTLSILLWPLSLLTGNWIATHSALSWLLLPPLNLLAIGLPVWWLVETGRRGLFSGSAQRQWGIFGAGAIASPVIVFIVEALALLGLMGVGALFVASRPDWIEQINRIAQRVINSNMDPEVVTRALTPLLRQPGIVFAMLAFSAGLVPIIEESLKTLALWLLPKQGLTEIGGFTAGLISGAAFGLVESLGFASNVAGSDWVTICIGRAGTGLLHMLTAALMGWALVSAWQHKKYFRLGLTYTLAIFIHGLWNLLNLLMDATSLVYLPTSGLSNLIKEIGITAPVSLILLIAVMLVILWRSNRYLRAHAASQKSSSDSML